MNNGVRGLIFKKRKPRKRFSFVKNGVQRFSFVKNGVQRFSFVKKNGLQPFSFVSMPKAEAFSRFKFFEEKLKPRTPILTLNSHG
jgi:hypothetical protein